MKRSEINALQREAISFFEHHQFYLPTWAFWSTVQWRENIGQASEIINSKLGWDLTDFGQNRFFEVGLLLFTIRNGKLDSSGGKTYAEKIMIVRENQVTPWHFHWQKMEDIINRGGGNLVIELCNASQDEQLADTMVSVQIDGITTTVEPQGRIMLKPGQSVTLPPLLYHNFYGQPGTGTVLVGEVSSVNDDENDNRFLQVARFPQIEEDEEPLYLLCNEYFKAGE